MRKNKSVILYNTCLGLLLIISSVELKESSPGKEKLKNEKLPPCAACRLFINNFKQGIERTSRGKFEGGDSAWEEDKLGSYAKSEVRLVEIQENLCKDIDRGENQCHALAEELESNIEEWWFKYQDTQPDIFYYICIEQTKRCCPKDHYGPDCTPCPGFPDRVCNNNGKCKGAGTRKGNGDCFCDSGYQGKNCSVCSNGYYQSYNDEDKFLCSKCHSACQGSCTGPGPKECEQCATGWRMIEEKGCFDIDECITNKDACSRNQFCVNKEGGYICLKCDKACDGCTGDGPDMCIKCAEGYHRRDRLCWNSDILGRKRQENMVRYSTYFGLCTATCIILQRNIYAASVIGLLVGVYITVSEYMIANSNVQDTTTNMGILEAAK